MSGTNNIFPGGAQFPQTPAPQLPGPAGGMGGQFAQPQINGFTSQFGQAGGAPNVLPPFLTGQQNVMGGPANQLGGGNPNLAMFGHFAGMPMQPPGAMQGTGGGFMSQPAGGQQPGQNANLMALFQALQNHPQLSSLLNPANIPNATQFQPPAQPTFTPPAQVAPAAPAAAPPASPAPSGGALTLAQLGVQNPNPDITSLPALQQQQAFNTQLGNVGSSGGGT